MAKPNPLKLENTENESCWAIILSGNKMLTLRRAKSANNGGLWNFPGGGLDKKEPAKKAILREIKEETGIDAGKLKYKSGFKLKVVDDGQIKNLNIFFFITQGRLKVKINNESDKFAWEKIEDFRKVNLAKLHKPTKFILASSRYDKFLDSYLRILSRNTESKKTAKKVEKPKEKSKKKKTDK